MVESILHKFFVKTIKEWILSFCSEEMIILCDSENSFLSKDIPPKIDSYIPDVFAFGRISKKFIIGEAKTSQIDLESEHTERQIIAYLKYCLKKKDSIFVLVVPLYLVNCGKSLLSYLKVENGCEAVQTHVTNPLLLN
jgi:hypothetical protein